MGQQFEGTDSTNAYAAGFAPASAATTADSAVAFPAFEFAISAGTPAHIAEVLSAQPTNAREALIARVHQLRGAAFLGQVLDAMPGATAPASPGGDKIERREDSPDPAPSNPKQSAIERATTDLRLISSALLPGYEDAIASLDAGGASALQAQAIDVYADARKLRDQLRTTQQVDAGPFAVIAWAQLAQLDEAITAAEHALGARIGPRELHGLPVLEGVPPLAIASAKDPAMILRAEASMTIGIVATAHEVVTMIAPGDESVSASDVSDSTAQQAAALVHPWRTRPQSFAYLKALLVERGLWSHIEDVHTRLPGGLPIGPTLADDDRKAENQAAEFGGAHDLRDFDIERAEALLRANLADDDADDITNADVEQTDPGRHHRTKRAREVLAAIYSADVAARGRVLEALERRGLLDALLSPLPFGAVEQLHDTLPQGTGHIRALIRPYFETKDRSNHSVSHYIDQLPGGGVLDVVANVATFGFVGEHDQAYGAMREGNITPGEYSASSSQAMQRAAIIGAASTLTAGAAGAYADGWTAGMAARSTVGRYAAGVIVGGVEGAAGGLGAQAGSDLADQQVSSPSDYVKSAGYGAAIGAGVSAVAGVGAAGARYLPPGVQTFAQKLAARFPHHADLFEPFRQLGTEHHGAAVQLRMRVGRLLALADDLHLANARPMLAAAGGGRALGPDDEVIITAQATRPFDQAGDLDGPAPISILKAERLPEDLVSREGDDLSSYLGDGPETTEGMHVFDGEKDAARQRSATAAATHSAVGNRTPLAEHIPPPGPAFVEWFDSLSLKELRKFLDDESIGGRIGAADVIHANIRHPGGLHEWLMVKHQLQIKKWGVSLQTVLDARTSTEATVGHHFKHGSKGSTTMHNDLSAMIADAPSFEAFKRRLNEWADRELFAVRGPNGEPPAGRYYLPSDLQVSPR